jgi:hypothetical protein
VGVAGDAAALVGADLVLVDDPIKGAAVTEAVVEDFGRDFGERESSGGVQQQWSRGVIGGLVGAVSGGERGLFEYELRCIFGEVGRVAVHRE